MRLFDWKRAFFALVVSGCTLGVSAQTLAPEAKVLSPEARIKNVVVMIPDGCSSELLSIGRWLGGGVPLNIDRAVKGLVRTYCSDSPIGDSAPTGSTYATGHRSRDGFVATYPDVSMDREGKRFKTDGQLAFSPMMTLLEAAKLQGKATGMVVTCFFSHATPADFLAHTPNRNQYFRIAKQMTGNPCDVLFGGGSYYVDSSSARFGFDAAENLSRNKVSYTRSFEEAKTLASRGERRIWGLFAPQDLAFEIDRPETGQPALWEMAEEALKILSQDTNGFFLMIEGSKIDWAAHDNDLPGAVYDFMAFDKTVGTVMDFAREDGRTLVLVMPDHQTGGLSMGNSNYNRGYARAAAEEIIGPLRKFHKSCDKAVVDIMASLEKENAQQDLDRVKAAVRESLEKDFSIENPSEEKIAFAAGIIRRNGVQDSGVRAFAALLNAHTAFGWTTHGHNGGDVFFACYHPQGGELSGVIDNERIAPYVCREAGLPDLDSMSRVYFTPLNRVFSENPARPAENPASSSARPARSLASSSARPAGSPASSSARPAENVRIYDASGRPDKDVRLNGRTPAGKDDPDPQRIEIQKVNGKTLILYPNSKQAVWGKKTIELPGMCLYNGVGFYVPAVLPELLR